MKEYIIFFVIVFLLFIYSKFKGHKLEDKEYDDANYVVTNGGQKETYTTTNNKKGLVEAIYKLVFAIIFNGIFMFVAITIFKSVKIQGIIFLSPFIIIGLIFLVSSIISLVKIIKNLEVK